jgi:hypothetical protein
MIHTSINVWSRHSTLKLKPLFSYIMTARLYELTIIMKQQVKHPALGTCLKTLILEVGITVRVGIKPYKCC